MPPTDGTENQPDQVDTHKVEKTGDKIETTDTHDEAGKAAVHEERKTVETPQE